VGAVFDYLTFSHDVDTVRIHDLGEENHRATLLESFLICSVAMASRLLLAAADVG
jgi:hypothetical protein